MNQAMRTRVRGGGFGRVREGMFDALEGRVLLVFDPTPAEQYMLELLNRMRTNPAAELGLLTSSLGTQAHSGNASIDAALVQFQTSGVDLQSQWNTLTAAPPLAWSSILYGTAQNHNAAMIAADMQTHQAPGEPDLGDRATNAGYTNWTLVGENIYAFSTSVLYGHAGFALDWGGDPTAPNYDGIQNPPGHRENMMDPTFREVGIRIANPGIVPNHMVGPMVITQDFGNRYDQGDPFLLGVVYGDTSNNGYSEGEGYGGVSVTAVAGNGSAGAPTYTTTSLTAGGWQMQVPAGTYAVTFAGAGFGSAATYYNVSVGSQNAKLDAVKGVAPPAPIIQLSGNGIVIANNDTTPNRNDWTDLGNANLTNQSISRSFNIYNAGNQNLTVLGVPRVVITGANAGDFSVTMDAGRTVTPHTWTTFTISFDPGAIGVRTAIVTILSSDHATPTFTFEIQGHGIQRPVASVSGNQQVIADQDSTPTTADWTNFAGINAQYTTKVRIFTITNTGLATMNVGTVTLTGLNVSRFAVFVQPATTLEAGASTQFRVRYTPGGLVGFAYATVHVASTDPVTPSYSFDIRGTGLAQARMQVTWTTTVVAAGDNTPSAGEGTDFASVGVEGANRVRLFTIKNIGLANLILTGTGPNFVTLFGLNAGDFFISGEPALTTLTPGQSTTFKVRFDPTAAGLRLAAVSIGSNDPVFGVGGGAYQFAVEGTGV